MDLDKMIILGFTQKFWTRLSLHLINLDHFGEVRFMKMVN